MMGTLMQRCRTARREVRLTQADVARRIGVSRAAYAQWETGKTKTINSEHLHVAAEALNVDAQWLATGNEQNSIAHSNSASVGGHIGMSIRSAREHKGISQSCLASRIGVSPQTVQQWESGMTMPRRHRINKIASVIGVSPYSIEGLMYEENDKDLISRLVRLEAENASLRQKLAKIESVFKQNSGEE